MPEGSVQCVVSSPPFWGLRDYGTGPQVWNGVVHAHEWGAQRRVRKAPAREDHSHGEWKGTRDQQAWSKAAALTIETGSFCACGAWRGSLGLEPTPELYVEHIVTIFREIRRVLAKDGTLWLNMGDCYASGAGAVGDHPGGGAQGARWKGEVNRHRDSLRRPHGRPAENGRGERQIGAENKTRATRDGMHAGTHTAMAAMGPMTQPNRMPLHGLKPKDLVGMPWRVAFALQADGWGLRRDVIWSKPNCMPESADDRPTTAHEYLFLLTKSARYYYNAAAIAEPTTGGAHARGNGVNPKADIPSGWDTNAGGHREKVGRYKAVSKTSAVRVDRGPRPRNKQNRSFFAAVTCLVEIRHLLAVWT